MSEPKTLPTTLRIPNAWVARLCVEGIQAHLRRNESPLAAEDLGDAVKILVAAGTDKPEMEI